MSPKSRALWWMERERRTAQVRKDILRKIGVLEKLMELTPPGGPMDEPYRLLREVIPDIRAAVSEEASHGD